MSNIAVLDTETNFNDEVMSIGVVAADASTFKSFARTYLILTPEYRKPAIFSNVLKHRRAKIDGIEKRDAAIDDVKAFLYDNNITDIYAYNASFDHNHLPELNAYHWLDIMKVAPYRQYNPKLPDDADYCGSGRLRSGYSTEQMYRYLSGSNRYFEVHNALADAEDELEIMRMIGVPVSVYKMAN